MHELRLQLKGLVSGDCSESLRDQQNHLEALWNHLLRRLAQKQSALRKAFYNLLHGSSPLTAMKWGSSRQKYLERWLTRLQGAVERFQLLPNVLNCTSDVDFAALKLVVAVSVHVVVHVLVISPFKRFCLYNIRIYKEYNDIDIAQIFSLS